MKCMALAKSIVVTSGGGDEELVLHGKTGFLVLPSDPNSLRCRIAQPLNDCELALKMGNEGKKDFKKNPIWGKMTTSYINLYRKITG
jgi:glycosyltransferase involved in cell wall biosynthesis